MYDQNRNFYHPADTNGDGQVDDYERQMYLEFKRKELEDQDAQRDAMRKMTWFALWGMLLYPVTIVVASWLDVDDAAKIIGDIAPTYFVAISALVAAFFGANAYANKKDGKDSSPPIAPPARPMAPAPAPAPTPTPTPTATAPAVPKVAVPKVSVPSKE
jgi:hypothetical protein